MGAIRRYRKSSTAHYFRESAELSISFRCTLLVEFQRKFTMIKLRFSKSSTLVMALSILAVAMIAPLVHGTLTWVGGATGDWTNPADWNPATAPTFTTTNTDDLVFDNTATTTTVDMRSGAGEEPVRSMTFSPGAPAFTFQRDINSGSSGVTIMGND